MRRICNDSLARRRGRKKEGRKEGEREKEGGGNKRDTERERARVISVQKMKKPLWRAQKYR